VPAWRNLQKIRDLTALFYPAGYLALWLEFHNYYDFTLAVAWHGGIVKCCGLGSDHAASFRSSLLSTNSPFTNLAPALTSGINR